MIKLEHIDMAYGDKQVLKDFSLTLDCPGQYALLGPSGRGKTTLLRLIAGLEKPQAGRILLPKDARIAYCFQENRLLPWKSIRENVALALSCPNRLDIAQSWLERVGLGCEGDSFPSSLSGGMKRRAALARALAFDASILLLDEPFQALDETMHESMLHLIRTHAKDKLLLLVTHDERDAQGMTQIHLQP